MLLTLFRRLQVTQHIYALDCNHLAILENSVIYDPESTARKGKLCTAFKIDVRGNVLAAMLDKAGYYFERLLLGE